MVWSSSTHLLLQSSSPSNTVSFLRALSGARIHNDGSLRHTTAPTSLPSHTKTTCEFVPSQMVEVADIVQPGAACCAHPEAWCQESVLRDWIFNGRTAGKRVCKE